jgi:predicted nucleic acid-binding protein
VSALVIDSSIALSWCFKDEATPETRRILDRVGEDGALVPALWHLETGNVLLQAERNGRITAADALLGITLMSGLPIETDEEATTRAWREILSLARLERLTTYNATYLELAVRRNVPLATRDRALHSAARRLKLPVLP